MAVSVSGIDNTKILQGRPYGGVCIMYRNELSSRCESVTLDTRRACAVKLSVNDNFKLLIVCVYMPCDPQLVNKVNVEYEAVLNRVEGLIQSTDCYTPFTLALLIRSETGFAPMRAFTLHQLIRINDLIRIKLNHLIEVVSHRFSLLLVLIASVDATGTRIKAEQI